MLKFSLRVPVVVQPVPVVLNIVLIREVILISIQGAMKRAYRDMCALSQRRRLSKRQVRLVVHFL